jgi:hypothetical protein
VIQVKGCDSVCVKAVVSVETFPGFVLSYLQGIDSPDKTLII